MSHAIRTGAALLALWTVTGCRSPVREATAGRDRTPPLRPLNVVIITVDTLRADRLGCYGYKQIDTPVLDGLAAHGVLFEDAVAQTPLTPPSHASIFTGQYPPVHNVRNTGGFVLQASAYPLARILHEQGWQTGAFVGSAVLKKMFGFANGFDLYDDEMPLPGKKTEFREDPERRAALVVDRAVAWLRSTSAGKPFLLWVHVFDPHIPYSPPQEYARKYPGRPYDGEIAYTDREIGRLLAAVEERSPRDRTVIAVLADHGESLGEHGESTHGVFLYDSTLRIPWLMAGAGIPAGVRVRQQARTIDFLPTVLELLGGRPPVPIQGVSLVGAMTGKPVDTDVSYAETLYPKMNMNWSELRSVRTSRWKYIRAPRPELYDLAADPSETRNVVNDHPAEVRKFEAQLVSLLPAKDGKETVSTAMVDERVMDQLKSLGYVGSASGRSYELTGTGRDPKDALDILKLIDDAESGQSSIPETRRLALLERALEKDPGNPSLYYQLAGRLEKNGRYEAAMQLYRRALSQGIDSGRLHSRIADLLVRRGEKDAAITEYEKAAQINPADLDSQNNLATAYLEKGRLADAERVFRWVVTNDAASAVAQNGLGLVSIQKQDFQSARGYFEKAVSLDPDLVEAHVNLGLLYKLSGDTPRARACFEAFLARAPRAQYAAIIPRIKQELATLR